MLPGPPSASWLFGNLKQLNETQEDRILDQWAEEYGPVVRISGFLNVRSSTVTVHTASKR